MKRANAKGIAVLGSLLLACSVWALASISAASAPDDPPQYSEWSTPANLGTVVNTSAVETDPFLSKDGLSLYFSSQRPGGYGGYDIWVSQRATVDDPWGPPQNLGPNINTSFNETNPFITIDGHKLFFASDHTSGFGGTDLYVSRRHNKRDDFGWRYPENLGPGVNTSANEAQPCLFEDEASGVISLYFSSGRAGGLGGNDIYASTLQEDETFGPAVLVAELSSPRDDNRAFVRPDGLEVYIASNRLGSILNLQGQPSFDIWVSNRASTSDPWSPPVNADPSGLLGINTVRHDAGPSLSFDGTTLYFHAAQRAGNQGSVCATNPGSASCFFDLWMTTRTKLKNVE